MFDLITISFDKELPMLELQARSLDKFFLADIGQIIVINNSTNKQSFVDQFLTLKHCYGRLESKVRLVDSRELLPEPGISSYYDQMALKILAQKLCNSDHVCILDNKNWFIRSVNTSDVLQGNRLISSRYPLTDPWNKAWLNSLEIFGLDQSMHDIRIATRTPFFVQKETLAELDSTCDVIELLSQSRKHSEFTLINAFILAKHGIWDDYFFLADNNDFETGVWPGYDPKENIPAIVAGKEMNNNTVISSGIHRNVWMTLSAKHREEIIADWVKIGLIDVYRAHEVFDKMVRLNPTYKII